MSSSSTRSRVRLAGLLSAVALLGACKHEGSSQHPDPGVRSEPEREAETQPRGQPIVFASVGIPHGSAISLVALDPEGKAALTRDLAGGVRFWPALDGSREPLVVPIRDPRAMALASDGAGNWTLALIDAAGGARLVGVDGSGKMQPLASLPPTQMIADLVVLPGGERLVVVGSDHVLHLLDRRGAELARLDRAGLRPATLRLAVEAEGSPRVVAVSAGEFDRQTGRFAVELLPLALEDHGLALAPGRQTLMFDAPPSTDNPSLSPDGRTAVSIQHQRIGGGTWLVVATQLEDGTRVTVDSLASQGILPRIGLLPEGRVLLDDGTGLGRVVDLRERSVELTALRTAPAINHQAASFAAGLRVAPASTYLAVHDLRSDELTYLGYEQISVNAAGISPSASAVAWSLGDRVAVESLGDATGEVFEVPGTRGFGQLFVGFLDEERLVMLDWSGGAKVVRWRDGELLSASDLGANVQLAELGRTRSGEAVMFVRTHLWQNPMVVELIDGRIRGRYLTHGANHLAGLLAPAAAGLDEWGAWTVDGIGNLRQFTLAQLREGVDVQAALQGGEPLASGAPEHFAVAADGTRYSVRTTGPRSTLSVERGSESEDVQLAAGIVTLLVPSPDGRRIAIVQERNPGQVVSIYDAASLQPLWAQPMQTPLSVSWSGAGEALAIPANMGGVVLDGDDGKPQTARCGLAFEARHTPPLIQGQSNQLSVCEL